MKGLEKIYWKLHPSWLGGIDSVKFSTLPLWKKEWQFAHHHQPIKFLTICKQFLNKRKGFTQVLKQKKKCCVQFLASSGLGSLNKLLTQPSAWQG